MHVPDRIDMHQGTHGRDEQQHHGSESVDGETDVNIERARGQPGVERETRLMAVGHIEEDHEREQPRHNDRRDGDKMGLVLDPMTEDPENQEGGKGKQWNQCVGHQRNVQCSMRTVEFKAHNPQSIPLTEL